MKNGLSSLEFIGAVLWWILSFWVGLFSGPILFGHIAFKYVSENEIIFCFAIIITFILIFASIAAIIYIFFRIFCPTKMNYDAKEDWKR